MAAFHKNFPLDTVSYTRYTLLYAGFIQNVRCIQAAQEKCYFYIWNDEISEVRLMTLCYTTKKDVTTLISTLKKALL